MLSTRRFHPPDLKDFSFMKKCQNVRDLRDRLLLTGVGAGQARPLPLSQYA